ncbi:MAG: MFS transporter [Candidatus Binataceae bacterium]
MAFEAGRWFPRSATTDGKRLLATRAMRGFADGAVSVLLPSYLLTLNFSAGQVGAIVFGTLLGSAALTLCVGLLSNRLGRKRLLLAACILMWATGLGFAATTNFWLLFVVAIIGTLNPSAGDVSLFLPVEQAALAQTVVSRDFTVMFAYYNVAGALTGAVGALASGLPQMMATSYGWNLASAQRCGFIAYSLIALAAALIYSRLSTAVEAEPVARPTNALSKSGGVVLKLSALFSIDSFGGGFVVQSLLALWLFRRFGLSVQEAGVFFFATGLLGAMSQLVSSSLAARFGRINTMVYTHLPANGFLILAALMPTAPLALGCLLLRSALSSMDVPARQSFVMAVVPAQERAAAASVTNVPRSLASAFAPLPAGLLLDYTLFGWPLVIGGTLKVIYDLLLLKEFGSARPTDESN